MPDALVRHFMSDSVVTVAPDAALDRVAASMSENRVSCVVVCDPDGRPLGVLSERDLTRAYARDAGRDAVPAVGSAMSEGVWTLGADATCAEAVAIMRERGIRRIVIVDEREVLAGIVTQTDLLRAHVEEIQIQKQVLEQRVVERTRELQALNTRLKSMARVDPMLGIGNRRAMDDELSRVHQRALRYHRPYAVALLDVDHFKDFNDTYGHAAGDEALKRVAGTLGRSVRAADAVFRYGGEEFLLLFPEVGADGAAIAAEHVRAAVQRMRIAHRNSPFQQLTASVGVAAERLDSPDIARLLHRADEALYAAKRGGRNRVECERKAASGPEAAQAPEPAPQACPSKAPACV